MSTSKQAVPGTRRATGEASGTGRPGKGRWSAKRKMAVVLELLAGRIGKTSAAGAPSRPPLCRPGAMRSWPVARRA